MSVDRRLSFSFVAALLAATAVPALAAPQLHPLLGDHAVLQRGEPLRISGTADAGERLTIALGKATSSVTADKTGRWATTLPAMRAGGPYTLQVRGANGSSAAASDVLIGDVWLCSGQSNMEYPVRRALNPDAEISRANDPELRIITIAKRTSSLPQSSFEEKPTWSAVTPQSVPDFSAACYFMTRELRKTQKVPIGAVDATWGGTPIRAWMDLASVRASGGGEPADLVELYRKDPAAAERRFGETWNSWWRKQTGTPLGKEPWVNSNALTWKPMPAFSVVDDWDASWADWNGAFWARRTISLTPEEAKQGATLSLGVIDDMDRTYVNGAGVGATDNPSKPRNYPIAADVLRPGNNEILVYVRDAWAQGGFRGPAEVAKLTFADGHSKEVGTDWQYSLIADNVGGPPSAPWEGSSGASTIYNGMIAPLGNLALKGAAWYQGETDVGQLGYDKRMAAMFANWRAQFREPNLPFLIVGLAGFGAPKSAPSESGWARTIDEQRIGVAADRAAAFVPAIDLGEWEDIHPANKQDVGKRLALAAEALAYRDPVGRLSPQPVSATMATSGVVVTFTNSLQALGGSSVTGFELCGDAQGSCRFADATISADKQVAIRGDGKPVTRVRFAWAESPVVNLYDKDLLPASPFEIPVTR
ncbi:MAG: sialate O-acetylesterase [Sphingomicrobium sp.]